MLTKWFGTRTPHQPTRESFVRPELEALEDRLPPSSVHGNGNVDSGNNIHNNIHINNSFNGNTNSFNGQNLAFLGFPQSTLTGFFTMLYKDAAAINPTAANSLVANEAQLAVDALLSLEGVSGLDSTISSLQSAIASNPLQSTMPGMLLGDVTFDLVLGSLAGSGVSASGTI